MRSVFSGGKMQFEYENHFFSGFFFNVEISAEQPTLLMHLWIPFYFWIWLLFHWRFPGKDTKCIRNLCFSGLLFKVQSLSKKSLPSAGQRKRITIYMWSPMYKHLGPNLAHYPHVEIGFVCGREVGSKKSCHSGWKMTEPGPQRHQKEEI